MVKALLDYLLENKFERDDREPAWFVELFGRTFGVTAIDPRFWMLSFLYLGFQSCINVIVAVVVYEGILKRRGSTFSFLVGFGFVIPTLLYLPVIIIPFFDLRNITFLGCVAMASPCLLTFRCLEAMFEVLPKYAYDTNKPHEKNSFRQFLIYYASAIQFTLNEKGDVVRVQWAEFQERILHFLRMFIETALLFSLMLHYKYQVFDVTTWPGRICNNFLMAYLTGASMEAGILGLGLMTSSMTGISTYNFHDHPFLYSLSPSDFWGKRWNKIIGQALRRAIYTPLRKFGVVVSVAAMITFGVSGIMHEYVMMLMAMRSGIPNNLTGEPFQPNYGMNLLFFVWNGVIMLLEYTLRGTSFVRFLTNNLPRPIRTALVLLTVLPVGHWFTDEYVRSSYYSDMAIGFPRIDLIH